MTMKFGRKYTLTVQIDEANVANNTLVVQDPITLEFEIERAMLSSTNFGVFRIYNLAEEKRRKIFHDRVDTTHYRRVTMIGGYETDTSLSVMFQGNIFQASSYRVGPDWITEISAFSGLYAIENNQVSLTIPSGWTNKDVLARLADAMTKDNLTVGAIGNIPASQNSRAITIEGNTWKQILAIAAGNDVFIDNEKIFILQHNEFVTPTEGLAVVDSGTGLLNTPRRYDGRIDVEILFEPRIQIGYTVVLKSLETVYNGTYSVQGVTHRGIISGAVNGKCTTKISILAPQVLGLGKLSSVSAFAGVAA